MTALKTVLLALAIFLAVLAAAFSVAALWMRKLRAEAAIALREECGTEEVFRVADCNFFGLLSSGLAQVRGNGLLALTEAGIRFRMLAPRRALFIPREAVRGVSNPRWFLKKSKAKELLRVDFVNDRGEEDAAAWLVRDLGWWSDAVSALRSDGNVPGHTAGS